MVDKCYFCKAERTGKWALLISPPVGDGSNLHIKNHVCPTCYQEILAYQKGSE